MSAEQRDTEQYDQLQKLLDQARPNGTAGNRCGTVDRSHSGNAERCELRDACAAHACGMRTHAQIHELAPLEERALVDQVSDRDRARSGRLR